MRWQCTAAPAAGVSAGLGGQHLYALGRPATPQVPMAPQRHRTVRAEHDDDDVPLVAGEGLELRALPVGRVAVLEQRGAAGPKVCDLGLVAQDDLQLPRVRVVAPAAVHARRDGVTDTTDCELAVSLGRALVARERVRHGVHIRSTADRRRLRTIGEPWDAQLRVHWHAIVRIRTTEHTYSQRRETGRGESRHGAIMAPDCACVAPDCACDSSPSLSGRHNLAPADARFMRTCRRSRAAQSGTSMTRAARGRRNDVSPRA